MGKPEFRDQSHGSGFMTQLPTGGGNVATSAGTDVCIHIGVAQNALEGEYAFIFGTLIRQT